jgi:glucose/arabinose dehydrogenase
MYIVANSYDQQAHPAMNHVTVYRSASLSPTTGVPTDFKPWFKTDIPFAIDVFQHGVSHIEQGPDGLIYVSSGSRTDHGERGDDEPNRYHGAEVRASSCIWRLDPKSDAPKLEIFADGIRNAYGFCFDDRGRMFATENGPNADPPEEVNLIERGQNYGFPYHFSDWDHPAYPDQPAPPPPGFHDRLPIQNVGPAGGTKDKPISTLDPHSSPSGIVFIRPGDARFPSSSRGTFLIARFGNLIALEKDVGFDVVQMRLIGESNGRLRAEVTPFLSPVARPTDIHLAANGKIYICEYQRQTRNGGGDLPGRILEISVSAPEGTSGEQR